MARRSRVRMKSSRRRRTSPPDLSGHRHVVAFKELPQGAELRDLQLLPKEHLRLALDACAKQGLDGFVDFDPGVDFLSLVQHVQQGGALVAFPTAGTLWVVKET